MKRDPYKYFRIEARELLDQLSRGVLELEAGRTVDFAALMRAAHTLKGAARIVKQKETADLAHAFEDRFGPFRDGGRPAPDDFTAALAILDAINVELGHLPAADAEETPAQPTAAPPRSRTIRVDVSDVESVLGALEEVQADLPDLRSIAVDAERARRLTLRLSSEVSPLRGVVLRETESSGAFARLRQLASDLHQLNTSVERRLELGIERINAGIRDVREKADRLRLVSADSLSTALQRLARDTADSHGKAVAFSFQSAAVRLDGDVLDAVQPALVQAVINAIVHGIEPAEVRARANKPVEGHVTVEVAQAGSRIAFRCRDDGGGIAVDAVKEAMRSRGLNVDSIAPDDVLESIMTAGVSTATSVSGYAGRGVGMGVVRDVAERLGGTASVQSAPGAGTTIELVVPVSLFGIEVLVLEYAAGRAAVPLTSVRGVQRRTRNEVVAGDNGPTIDFNGSAIRVIPLGRALRAPSSVVHERAATPVMSVVLVGDERAGIALVADRVIGTQVVVQRALPSYSAADAVVSGVYIDADGNPRPVLDPSAFATMQLPERRQARPVVKPKPVLVVDDSLTTRMLERSILESAGYEVVTANSGEEGLEVARAGDFGMILVDVEMPGMDGFTFVARCRSDPVLRDMPCVLVTSLDAPEHRARGLAAGANDYVVKTVFDQNDFLDRVRELIRR